MIKQKTNQEDLYKGFENGFTFGINFLDAQDYINKMVSAKEMVNLGMIEGNNEILRGAGITKRLYELQSKIGKEYPKQFLGIDISQKLSNLIRNFNEVHKDLCEEYAIIKGMQLPTINLAYSGGCSGHSGGCVR